jgi:hypothetical protein
MLSTKMSRVLLAVKTILAVFASTVSFSVSASSGVLSGKWNHVKMVQSADSKIVRVHESAGKSSLEFNEDGTWVMTSPRNTNSGTYKLANGNSLETTILQSDIPKQVGWHSVKQIEIEGTTLKLITKYDQKAMEAFAPRPDGNRAEGNDCHFNFRAFGRKIGLCVRGI